MEHKDDIENSGVDIESGETDFTAEASYPVVVDCGNYTEIRVDVPQQISQSKRENDTTQGDVSCGVNISVPKFTDTGVTNTTLKPRKSSLKLTNNESKAMFYLDSQKNPTDFNDKTPTEPPEILKAEIGNRSDEQLHEGYWDNADTYEHSKIILPRRCNSDVVCGMNKRAREQTFYKQSDSRVKFGPTSSIRHTNGSIEEVTITIDNLKHNCDKSLNSADNTDGSNSDDDVFCDNNRRFSDETNLLTSQWINGGAHKDSLKVYRSKLNSTDGESTYTTMPQNSILKKSQSNNLRSFLTTVTSGLYGMVLIVMGAVMPISEVSTNERHPILFQVFCVYLYTGSIAFVFYIYIYFLRRWPFGFWCSRLTCWLKKSKPKSWRKRRRRKTSVDMGSSHSGSFYLRLGAVAFGAGSMIHSGLQIGQYFVNSEAPECQHPFTTLRHAAHLLFTFVQLCFIFLHSKMCINRYRSVAKFGVMHMVATNMSVWVRVIVQETVGEIDEAPQHKYGEYNSTQAEIVAVTHESIKTTGWQGVDCDNQHNIISDVIHSSSPYLYPCTIEYSLIAAGILYVMWKNIGRRQVIRENELVEANMKNFQMSVDCTNSSLGLFLGIIVLVASIISMITFFVFIRASHYNDLSNEERLYYTRASIFTEHLTEIAIYILTIGATVLAAVRMQTLRFDPYQSIGLEEILILLALLGDYIFGMFSIIAASFDTSPLDNSILIISSVLGMLQATLQTVFILSYSRRSPATEEHKLRKQGKQSVMFLLMCNIALWGISTFEVMRADANPVQIHYYGPLAWNIFMHISLPLIIFYRFHSTVCLSNVWKNAWKRRS